MLIIVVTESALYKLPYLDSLWVWCDIVCSVYYCTVLIIVVTESALYKLPYLDSLWVWCDIFCYSVLLYSAYHSCNWKRIIQVTLFGLPVGMVWHFLFSVLLYSAYHSCNWKRIIQVTLFGLPVGMVWHFLFSVLLYSAYHSCNWKRIIQVTLFGLPVGMVWHFLLQCIIVQCLSQFYLKAHYTSYLIWTHCGYGVTLFVRVLVSRAYHSFNWKCIRQVTLLNMPKIQLHLIAQSGSLKIILTCCERSCTNYHQVLKFKEAKEQRKSHLNQTERFS